MHENGDRVRTLEARIARAEQRLTAMPDPAPLLTGLTTDSDPATRLAAFENLIATYGTAYHPACLQKCGAAFYCREAAYDTPARLGATRLLGRAGSIHTALDWAGGTPPSDPQSVPVAQRLTEVAALTAVARTDAGLPTGPIPGPRRRRSAS